MKRSCDFLAVAALFCLFTSIPASPAVRPDDAVRRQSSLSGRVVDSADGTPAGWTTVALMAADSIVVTGSTCDADGVFSVSAPEGEYTLKFSLIGYKDHIRSVLLSPGGNTLPDVRLEADVQMLAGAAVTERVKLVEMKIDKVVVNVKESAFAQGSNALELIKKSPGVTVDKDGNIKLNGKAVSVWIDGRPSHADGKSLEALLQSTNGESIDRFELMEHPSSKYDASGQGGIINIRTKRNVLGGFNGSVGLGGGGMVMKQMTSNPWQESAWANLSYRTAKTNSFLNLYEGVYDTPLNVINRLRISSIGLRQDGESALLSRFISYSVKLGTDWFINDRNTVGAILYFPGSSHSISSSSGVTWQYLLGDLASSSSTSISNGPNRSIRHNLNLNWTHVFDESRSAELTSNLDYCHNTSKDDNGQTDTTVFFTDPSSIVTSRQSMSSTSIYDIYSVKSDYQTVIAKKYMLEAGVKWALSRTDNKSVESRTLVPDILSDFIYSEHVAALYASFAGQIGQKWSFKAGLRGEYTHSLGDWKSSGDKTVRSYFDVFPTVYFGYTPSQKFRLSLSYSRRISRPGYYELNPVKTFFDAKSYTVGNPDILPEYSDDVSLSAGFGQYLSLTLGYDHTSNVVTQIPTFDADGIQYLTWGNVGRQHLAYASLNVSSLPLGKWLQWTLSVSGLYIDTRNSLTGVSDRSFGAQGYTALSVLLPSDWKVEIDGYASSPMTWGYFRIKGTGASNIALKKTIASRNLTLGLRLDDIFRSSTMDMDIRDGSVSGQITNFQQKYGNQKLVFDLSWSFGKAQAPVRARRVGNLEEMSRVGSGQGAKVGK